MPAVQVVYPRGHEAERAYTVRAVLGALLGVEHTAEAGDVDSWELRVGDAVVHVPDVLFAAPEEQWLSLELGGDLFGTAFLLLTRYEETAIAERDEHDRFPVTATRSDLDRPQADDAAETLWRQLREAAPRLERREPAFRVVPSHDVDYPFASTRLRLSGLLRGQL